MWGRLGVLAALLLCLAGSTWAQGGVQGDGKRVALVIGNGAYLEEARLPNPPNDAEDVAAHLEKLGFVVTKVIDAGKPQLDRALRRFGDNLSGAQVALFFYAGHGLQVGGRNYLLPIDAKLAKERDLAFEAVDTTLVLDQMENQAAINLIFLDACRNNPFARSLARAMGTRSTAVGTGLAQVTDSRGSLIVFATQPGNVAEDGVGQRNSPFTTALLQYMATPGLEVRQMLTRVRGTVMETTGGRQVPWDHSSLIRDFYFIGPTTVNVTPAAAPAGVDPSAMELRFWESAEKSGRAEDYQAYLDRFPDGVFAGLARNRTGGAPPPNAPAPQPSPSPAPQVAMAPPQPAAPTPPVVPTIGVFAPRSDLKPGDVFRDCTHCPELVVVPAGDFEMGSPRSEPGNGSDERPQTRVTIPRPLAVGRFEVTFAEWDVCVSAGGCAEKPSDEGWGRERRPVINVNWPDVQAYLAWLGKLTGARYRLLTEAEWEYAARSGTTGPWPWGTASAAGFAHCSECGSPFDSRQTAPVGSFRANAFGLHDMHGNVREWLEDCFQKNLQGQPTDGTARTGSGCNARSTRGGAGYDTLEDIRSARRTYNLAGQRTDFVGFRVARELR